GPQQFVQRRPARVRQTAQQQILIGAQADLPAGLAQEVVDSPLQLAAQATIVDVQAELPAAVIAARPTEGIGGAHEAKLARRRQCPPPTLAERRLEPVQTKPVQRVLEARLV